MQKLVNQALLCLLLVGLAAPLVAQERVSLLQQYYRSALKSAEWPEAVLCGETFEVDVTMVNTTNTKWTESGFHKLGPLKGEDEVFRPDGFKFKMPDGTEVPLRGEHTFTLELTAPDTPGTFETQWSMMMEGKPYGTPVVQSIDVYCDDAELGRALFPEEVACGAPFTAEVRMRNNGASTWTEEEFYKLGPVLGTEEAFRPDGHKFKMPNGTAVPVGEKYVFELDLTAPEDPGVYATKWSMMNSGSPFGEEVARIIRVSCGSNKGPDRNGRE